MFRKGVKQIVPGNANSYFPKFVINPETKETRFVGSGTISYNTGEAFFIEPTDGNFGQTYNYMTYSDYTGAYIIKYEENSLYLYAVARDGSWNTTVYRTDATLPSPSYSATSFTFQNGGEVITSDAYNNIYLAIYNSYGTPYDGTITKLSSDGAVIYSTAMPHPASVYSLVADSQGNAIFAENEYYLVKVDTSGTVSWEINPYSGNISGNINDIDVDLTDDNIFVAHVSGVAHFLPDGFAGWDVSLANTLRLSVGGDGIYALSTTGTAGSNVVTKLSKVDGSTIWSYPLTSTIVSVGNIATDSQNNFYVIYADPSTTTTLHIDKYDSAHTLQWSTPLTSATYAGLELASLRVDAHDNVYAYTRMDYVDTLYKLDSSGNILWNQALPTTYQSTGNAFGYAVRG